MESTDKRILQSALGEHRLNPDQQRYYLGTFAERILLTIPLEGIDDHIAREEFERLLPTFVDNYQPLSLKLSSDLNSDTQMFFMKLASKKSIPSTIIDETGSTSPFALVLHTDHAVNLDETSITSSIETKPTNEVPPKKNLSGKNYLPINAKSQMAF
ncbi:YueI family protein [Streptococcus iniae]